MLPPEVKEGTAYARRNTQLRHWVVAIIVGIAGIAGIVFAGQLYLQNSIHLYQVQVDEGNQTLKDQNLESTQKQVEDLTNSLKLVVQVLQREILFSKLLTQIGSGLPNGSILTNLSINKVQGGLDLSASATDYQTATQVQINLQDPKNKLFDKADIINILCGSKSTTSGALSSQYPCTIQLRALFAKNNPFTFIAPTPTGSTSQ